MRVSLVVSGAILYMKWNENENENEYSITLGLLYIMVCLVLFELCGCKAQDSCFKHLVSYKWLKILF
jgi:hypothetical protein